jgi:hypothetical protein
LQHPAIIAFNRAHGVTSCGLPRLKIQIAAILVANLPFILASAI